MALNSSAGTPSAIVTEPSASPNDLPPWIVIYQQTQWYSALFSIHALQGVTNEGVAVAFVNQGYSEPSAIAAANGIKLVAVKLPEMKKGFLII